MRLDHLLSKEQAEVETRTLILWSIRLRSERNHAARSSIKAAKSSAKENAKRSKGNLLKLANWFCIVFRVYPELHLDNCTRENDSKIRPVAKRSNRRQRKLPHTTMNRTKQLVSGRSDEKIKLIRAQGGCPGTIRRRRSWQAAKSYGEPQAGIDP